MEEVEIQASHIVGRLEEAIEKATEAVQALEFGGEIADSVNEEHLGLRGDSWQQVQGFLQAKGR